MTAPKPERAQQAKALADGFAADVTRGIGETAAKRRQITGTTGEASLQQIARDIGMRAVELEDGAVMIIAGKGYK